jgi:hypothetical protein
VVSTSAGLFMIPQATRATGVRYGVVEAMILRESSRATVSFANPIYLQIFGGKEKGRRKGAPQNPVGRDSTSWR